jgi:hypothetical protein
VIFFAVNTVNFFFLNISFTWIEIRLHTFMCLWGGRVGDPNLFLHIYFSLVEIRLHAEFQLPMLLRSGRFMVGATNNKAKVSMKLEASLAPARAEVEAGVVAKADQ